MQLERLARRGYRAATGGYPFKVCSTLVLAAVCGLAAGPAAADTFTAIDLGTLGGATSAADGIGPSGASATATIVGSSKIDMTDTHAFYWKDADSDGVADAAEIKDLGTLKAADAGSSYATAVNKNGLIVGYSINDDDDTHATLWKDGNADGDYADAGEEIDLGTLAAMDAGDSYALAINSSGQIVGYSETDDSDIHACLWQDKNDDGDFADAGEKVDLGTLVAMDAGDSQANGINDDGLIVGWSETTDGGDKHATLWEDANSDDDFADAGEETDLGTLVAANAGDSQAFAINSSGEIVGWSEITDGGNKHAFLYSDEAMVDLGTLGGNASEAYGINNLGQIVGKAQNSAAAWFAFLYSDGAMYDLNALAGSTQLKAATSINDAMQITGDGNDGTDDYAFRVTPDSAASAVVLKADSVKGGKALAGTITLAAAAPAGGARVNLTSDKTSATVPDSVLVPEGKTSANFSVTTAAVAADATVKITAGRGLSVTDTFTLSAAIVSKVAVKPSSVAGGASAIGTVTLDGAAPSAGATVDLESSDEDSATVPATVTVAAGKTSATFTVETEVVTSNKSVTLSGVIGAGTDATATLAVTTGLVSTVVIAPATVGGGKLAIGKVTLSGAAPTGGIAVTLTSSDTDTATVPATVTVLAGATTATFPVKTKLVTADTAITVEGKTGDSDKKTGKLKVTAPTLSTLALTKSSLTGGGSLKGVVTLTGRSASDTTVTLSDGDAASTDPGASVVVKAGATSAAFSISTSSVTADTKVTIKATLGKVTKSAALTVKK